VGSRRLGEPLRSDEVQFRSKVIEVVVKVPHYAEVIGFRTRDLKVSGVGYQVSGRVQVSGRRLQARPV
jgi:hypothetical protein